MFERWERCEATVVARQVRTSGTEFESEYDYVLDVVPPGAAPLRVTIHEGAFDPEDGFRKPQVGEVISVLFDPQTQQITFDIEDPRLSLAVLTPNGMPASNGSDPEMFFGRTPDVLASMHTPPGGISSDPGERLAKLQALKEQGFMTDDEYQLQRQRIIDTI